MDIKKSMYPEEKDKFPWDDDALQAFKQLIKDQGIKCRMDDIFLLGFLRARKFDIQRSIKILKNYYNVRIEHPQFFKDLLPSKLEHAFTLKTTQFFPKPDQKGRYMYFFEFGKWDTSVANVTDIFRITMLIMDFMLNFHRTQENCTVLIVDASGISLSQFLQMSPRLLNSTIKIIMKDSYPLRYKEIHYVNLNIIIKAVLSIIVPLLPTKLQERLHFHSDMKTLHEFINPEHLPTELGGTLSVDQSEFINMIKANEEFFRKNEEYLRMYEEEKSKHFSEGKYTYVGEDEDEKVKKFVEKSEENFKRYGEDPEAFLAALKQDSEFEVTHF